MILNRFGLFINTTFHSNLIIKHFSLTFPLNFATQRSYRKIISSLWDYILRLVVRRIKQKNATRQHRVNHYLALKHKILVFFPTFSPLFLFFCANSDEYELITTRISFQGPSNPARPLETRFSGFTSLKRERNRNATAVSIVV